MTEALSNVLQMTAAAASVILMGVCGVCLCARLTRVMRGQENASGLTKEPFQIPLPFREMALAAAAGDYKTLTRAHHLDTRAGDHAAAMDPDENGQLILLRLRR